MGVKTARRVNMTSEAGWSLTESPLVIPLQLACQISQPPWSGVTTMAYVLLDTKIRGSTTRNLRYLAGSVKTITTFPYGLRNCCPVLSVRKYKSEQGRWSVISWLGVPRCSKLASRFLVCGSTGGAVFPCSGGYPAGSAPLRRGHPSGGADHPARRRAIHYRKRTVWIGYQS